MSAFFVVIDLILCYNKKKNINKERINKMNKIHNNLTIENLIKTEDFKQLTIKERKELITSSQWFNQFDKKQQEEILDGACYNLDISAYAKPEFDYYQMDEIKKGLKKGLDVSVYAKSEFN